MPSNTPNLGLYKKDPVADRQDLFDIKQMMNDNWDKIDTSYGTLNTASEAATIDIAALKDRLNTKVIAQLNLAVGMQTITADRDKPYNMTGAKGRLLQNILGRAGSFDSLSGWTFTGSSGTILPSTNANSVGSSLLQLSLTSATGRVSRSIPTVPGKYYLLAADIKLGTATSAKADTVGMGTSTGTMNTSVYQTAFLRFNASSSTHNIGVTVTGASGQTAFIDNVRVYEISTSEYTALANSSMTQVGIDYPYTEGLAGVKNPYAIRWTDDSKSLVAAMLAFEVELLAPPVVNADADRDMLTMDVAGQYYKDSAWRKLKITGAEPWTLSSFSISGAKRVQTATNITPAPTTMFGVKYNALPLITSGALSAPDQFLISDNLTYVVVGQADSGWGDNYSPTSDEIKAYFYGYKMYDSGTFNATQAQAATTATYNGTGTKQWVNLIGSPVGTNLPSVPASGYTAYEMMYLRSSRVKEPIAFEGAISLKQGNNYVEVGSGLEIREVIRPFKDGVAWNINNGNPQYESSLTTLRVDRFIGIYKDGRVDNWTQYPNTITVAGALAQQAFNNYSEQATYTVSYLPVKRYPASSLVGSTPNNEKAIIDDLIVDMQQISSRVSIAELRKLERESKVPWINPTLLNLWSSDGSSPMSYRRKDGTVNFTGIIINGIASNGTVLFKLPEGFRPLQEHHFVGYTYQISDGSFGSVEIIVRVNGDVVVGTGGKSYISFAGMNYVVF